MKFLFAFICIFAFQHSYAALISDQNCNSALLTKKNDLELNPSLVSESQKNSDSNIKKQKVTIVFDLDETLVLKNYKGKTLLSHKLSFWPNSEVIGVRSVVLLLLFSLYNKREEFDLILFTGSDERRA